MDWLIVAAFLIQQGRTDALRRMWIGVGAAVAVCLAVAVVHAVLDRIRIAQRLGAQSKR